ncbi:GNAT family N-acetyltransferase [Yinghuangia sp. YIM S09857]|uniref:GNAT family N-acetyltransferase n=1 Tax=Yinghuangia sp. YIM S09857 TaxID=3436929 RepID=UPI003F53E27A
MARTSSRAAARTSWGVDLVDLTVADADAEAEPGVARFRDAVRALAPRADQEEFSGRAADTLPIADRDPFRTPYAVVHDGTAVGFGVLDVQGYLDEIADEPGRAVLLRGFYIGAEWQRRGFGGAAIRALPETALKLAPWAEVLLLTVNVRNAGAVRAYLAGGFVDDGRRYYGGDAGPQHILRLELAAY